MSKRYQTAIAKKVPEDFCEETVKTICRIESVHTVIGTLFLRNDMPQMYTVPVSMAKVLTNKLPALNKSMHRAVTEIDIQDELVAFRLQARGVEYVVAGGLEFAAVVVHKAKRKRRAIVLEDKSLK